MTLPPAARGWSLALLPVALMGCCWLWWWLRYGFLQPGVQIGRSADLMLILGAIASAWIFYRRGSASRALLPLLAALAWQALALSWAPVSGPGVLWLTERAAALAVAAGLALWLRCEDDAQLEPAITGAALAGAGILALTCLTQIGNLATNTRLGEEAPFGNVNFAVGAALPLVALGLTRFLHGGTLGWWIYALAAGGLAGLLGGGRLGGDPTAAVWLGGGAALATALILRLPARCHLPLLALGALGLIGGAVTATSGAWDPSSLGAGAAQRIHLWRSAGEALMGAQGLIGWGPGSAIAVLPEQPAFAAAWLTVPSYPEHAHCEVLQILLDGGLILAALLAWALWLTLRPLWLRRQEAACAALLVAWCTAGTHALIESHLSQPGGLLCLAILAGLSWAAAPPLPIRRWIGLTAAGPGLVLAWLVVRGLIGDGVSPSEAERRAWDRIAANGDDPAATLATLDQLRQRFGPLERLDLERARQLGRLRQSEAAAAALATHLRRLPVDAEALALAARLRAASRATPELVAAEFQARQRAASVLATTHETARNAEARAALSQELARDRHDGQAPDR